MKKYRCNNCGEIFSQFGRQVFPNNFDIKTPGSSVSTKNGERGVPCCPNCNYMFFFIETGYREEKNAKTYAK